MATSPLKSSFDRLSKFAEYSQQAIASAYKDAKNTIDNYKDRVKGNIEEIRAERFENNNSILLKQLKEFTEKNISYLNQAAFPAVEKARTLLTGAPQKERNNDHSAKDDGNHLGQEAFTSNSGQEEGTREEKSESATLLASDKLPKTESNIRNAILTMNIPDAPTSYVQQRTELPANPAVEQLIAELKKIRVDVDRTLDDAADHAYFRALTGEAPKLGDLVDEWIMDSIFSKQHLGLNIRQLEDTISTLSEKLGFKNAFSLTLHAYKLNLALQDESTNLSVIENLKTAEQIFSTQLLRLARKAEYSQLDLNTLKFDKRTIPSNFINELKQKQTIFNRWASYNKPALFALAGLTTSLLCVGAYYLINSSGPDFKKITPGIETDPNKINTKLDSSIINNAKGLICKIDYLPSDLLKNLELTTKVNLISEKNDLPIDLKLAKNEESKSANLMPLVKETKTVEHSSANKETITEEELKKEKRTDSNSSPAKTPDVKVKGNTLQEDKRSQKTIDSANPSAALNKESTAETSTPPTIITNFSVFAQTAAKTYPMEMGVVLFVAGLGLAYLYSTKKSSAVITTPQTTNANSPTKNPKPNKQTKKSTKKKGATPATAAVRNFDSPIDFSEPRNNNQDNPKNSNSARPQTSNSSTPEKNGNKPASSNLTKSVFLKKATSKTQNNSSQPKNEQKNSSDTSYSSDMTQSEIGTRATSKTGNNNFKSNNKQTFPNTSASDFFKEGSQSEIGTSSTSSSYITPPRPKVQDPDRFTIENLNKTTSSNSPPNKPIERAEKQMKVKEQEEAEKNKKLEEKKLEQSTKEQNRTESADQPSSDPSSLQAALAGIRLKSVKKQEEQIERKPLCKEVSIPADEEQLVDANKQQYDKILKHFIDSVYSIPENILKAHSQFENFENKDVQEKLKQFLVLFEKAKTDKEVLTLIKKLKEGSIEAEKPQIAIKSPPPSTTADPVPSLSTTSSPLTDAPTIQSTSNGPPPPPPLLLPLTKEEILNNFKDFSNLLNKFTLNLKELKDNEFDQEKMDRFKNEVLEILHSISEKKEMLDKPKHPTEQPNPLKCKIIYNINKPLKGLSSKNFHMILEKSNLENNWKTVHPELALTKFRSAFKDLAQSRVKPAEYLQKLKDFLLGPLPKPPGDDDKPKTIEERNYSIKKANYEDFIKSLNELKAVCLENKDNEIKTKAKTAYDELKYKDDQTKEFEEVLSKECKINWIETSTSALFQELLDILQELQNDSTIEHAKTKLFTGPSIIECGREFVKEINECSGMPLHEITSDFIKKMNNLCDKLNNFINSKQSEKWSIELKERFEQSKTNFWNWIKVADIKWEKNPSEERKPELFNKWLKATALLLDNKDPTIKVDPSEHPKKVHELAKEFATKGPGEISSKNTQNEKPKKTEPPKNKEEKKPSIFEPNKKDLDDKAKDAVNSLQNALNDIIDVITSKDYSKLNDKKYQDILASKSETKKDENAGNFIPEKPLKKVETVNKDPQTENRGTFVKPPLNTVSNSSGELPRNRSSSIGNSKNPNVNPNQSESAAPAKPRSSSTSATGTPLINKIKTDHPLSPPLSENTTTTTLLGNGKKAERAKKNAEKKLESGSQSLSSSSSTVNTTSSLTNDDDNFLKKSSKLVLSTCVDRDIVQYISKYEKMLFANEVQDPIELIDTIDQGIKRNLITKQTFEVLYKLAFIPLAIQARAHIRTGEKNNGRLTNHQENFLSKDSTLQEKEKEEEFNNIKFFPDWLKRNLNNSKLMSSTEIYEKLQKSTLVNSNWESRKDSPHGSAVVEDSDPTLEQEKNKMILQRRVVVGDTPLKSETIFDNKLKIYFISFLYRLKHQEHKTASIVDQDELGKMHWIITDLLEDLIKKQLPFEIHNIQQRIQEVEKKEEWETILSEFNNCQFETVTQVKQFDEKFDEKFDLLFKPCIELADALNMQDIAENHPTLALINARFSKVKQDQKMLFISGNSRTNFTILDSVKGLDTKVYNLERIHSGCITSLNSVASKKIKSYIIDQKSTNPTRERGLTQLKNDINSLKQHIKEEIESKIKELEAKDSVPDNNPLNPLKTHRLVEDAKEKNQDKQLTFSSVNWADPMIQNS